MMQCIIPKKKMHHSLYFILFEVFFCGLFWFPAVSTTALQCHSCDLAVTVSVRALLPC